MTATAIEAERVSKEYARPGGPAYGRLSERLTEWVRRPSVSAAPRRESIPALRDVSFRIQAGEIVGVIGRNGAGKSTLLRILSRITRPTRGRVGVAGRVGSLLEVGTGFHPELTGRENVFLNGSILGQSRREIQTRFDQIVSFAEVESFIDLPVKHYSSGMRVRLAFAVAAHLDAEILLLDEVLAVGDAAFQQKCFGKMGAVAQDGRTVLLVSHNLPSIANLCPRAIWLEQGSLIADAPSREVVAKYLEGLQSTVAGERVWAAGAGLPGNDFARLHAVRLVQGGTPASSGAIDISRSFRIEIEYESLVDGQLLFAGVWLKTESQTWILSSTTAPSMGLGTDAWWGRPRPIGRYRSCCEVPGDFLNEGRYEITPIVGRTIGRSDAIVERALVFEAVDSGGMRQDYGGSWAGPVLRPRLAWQTEALPAAAGS